MPLANGWSNKQAPRAGSAGAAPVNHALRQSSGLSSSSGVGAAKGSTSIKTSHDKPRWDGRVRPGRVALSSSSFNTSKTVTPEKSLDEYLVGSVTPEEKSRVAGEREAFEAELQEMQQQRQHLVAEQEELESLAAEVREKRSRTEAELLANEGSETSLAEWGAAAVDGIAAAKKEIADLKKENGKVTEKLFELLARQALDQVEDAQATREEQMAMWRVAPAPQETRLVAHETQRFAGVDTVLRERNQELEEVSIGAGREIRAMAAKVSGLEQKLEAALEQLQRRTHQLAETETRALVLDQDCRQARERHARVVHTLDMQERQVVRLNASASAGWAASPATTPRVPSMP
ncbi:hypothetical protein T484DRAFT_2024280, partial [Baffinella frigidus]